jgi:hypothetical protein
MIPEEGRGTKAAAPANTELFGLHCPGILITLTAPKTRTGSFNSADQT